MGGGGGGSTWEYLPDMNEVRNKAIAEVLPSTRKYMYKLDILYTWL